jgi:hypothetical protein
MLKLNTAVHSLVGWIRAWLDDLDWRFQALLKQLEDAGICCRDVDYAPIIPKEQWLQAQWVTIQKLARGEEL